jgi:hypothetical protein
MPMCVVEVMTLLKQFEAANPGRDVQVQVTFDEWREEEGGSYKTRTGVVKVRDIKWDVKGPVLVAEVLP